MSKRKGILLVSFLVYLILFSMVTFLINHVITKLVIPSFSSLAKNTSIVALHIASDIFVRDVVKIQEHGCVWKVVSPHELVWQIDDLTLGWYFSENSLKRKEGASSDNWRNVKKSIIAKDLIDTVFIIEKDKEDIIGIELIMKPRYTPEKPIKCYVSIGKRHEK